MVGQQPLNRCCDLFLDSVGWSGCNSTLEALACGLPVVTWPGELMRGRAALRAARTAARELLYDESCVRGLEEFLEAAVRRA